MIKFFLKETMTLKDAVKNNVALKQILLTEKHYYQLTISNE